MQAVSIASSQLLQPLLALASAPHKAVMPWHSTQQEDGTAQELEQSAAIPTQQTPISAQRPVHALMHEMLESPVTVSKPQLGASRASFRKQSDLGMQQLDDNDRVGPTDCKSSPCVIPFRQMESNAACVPSDRPHVAAAAEMVVDSDTDVNGKGMPDCDRPAIATASQSTSAASADPTALYTSATPCAQICDSELHNPDGQLLNDLCMTGKAQEGSHLAPASEQLSALRHVAAASQQSSQCEQQCSGTSESGHNPCSASQACAHAVALVDEGHEQAGIAGISTMV